MTTFFTTGAGRQVVDCWSSRLASFRTTEILIVRRVERVLPAIDAPAPPSPPSVGGVDAPVRRASP